jgi:RNA polymerase sigma-70 factor (ECF subfamily)
MSGPWPHWTRIHLDVCASSLARFGHCVAGAASDPPFRNCDPRLIFSAIVPHWPALAAAEEPADAEARVARIEGIFHRHLDAVWRAARDLGVVPRDLEDVVQEVLVVCVRRLHDIEPERERAFVLATTARVAANWRRGRRRRPAEPVESLDGLGPEALELQHSRNSPAAALEHKRELELVQSALDQMTEPQRVAFTLFEIEGLTAREMALELGLSEAVIFARVQRARAVFQRCLARVKSAPRRLFSGGVLSGPGPHDGGRRDGGPHGKGDR